MSRERYFIAALAYCCTSCEFLFVRMSNCPSCNTLVAMAKAIRNTTVTTSISIKVNPVCPYSILFLIKCLKLGRRSKVDDKSSYDLRPPIPDLRILMMDCLLCNLQVLWSSYNSAVRPLSTDRRLEHRFSSTREEFPLPDHSYRQWLSVDD